MWGRVPWNAGKTKETDERVNNTSKKLKGKPKTEEHKRNSGAANKGRKAWDEGLTKETDPRVKKSAETQSHNMKGSLNRHLGMKYNKKK